MLLGQVASVKEGELFHVETVEWTGGQIHDDDSSDDIKHVDLCQVPSCDVPSLLAVSCSMPHS